MIIRENNPHDKLKIVELLQMSLGEAKLKKSEEIWNFKHQNNPFGVSPVLLAEEANTLVGVRAFMQWRWQLENEVWISYRAVDTATHPNYQGKGIFKSLTMKALEVIKEKSNCFVFNTPNEQSRPGYLKMDWKQVGKINVALVVTFFYLFKLFQKNPVNESIVSENQIDKLCEIHNKRLVDQKVIFTPKSAKYLKWRYEENLLQKYHVIATEDFYIAMYVKKHRFYRELRVVEIIKSESISNNLKIKSAIIKYAFKHKCWLLSLADKELFNFSLHGSFGPMLTFRDVRTDESFSKRALNIHNWSYSIGDLELF